MQNTSDEDLLDFKNGGTMAFSQIYNRFKKPIYQYIAGRIFDAQVAEEVTQEVFFKVYRFRDSYDEKRAFSTWLWTIARNTVFDALRRTKSNDLEIADHGQVVPDLEEIPSPLFNAESLLQVKELRCVIRGMMRPLTRLQRRVLWMRIIHQRSYAEISEKMGLSISAVKNLAYRAKLTITDSFGSVPDFA